MLATFIDVLLPCFLEVMKLFFVESSPKHFPYIWLVDSQKETPRVQPIREFFG